VSTSHTKLANEANEGNKEDVSDHGLAQPAEAATFLLFCSDHSKVSLEAEVPEALLAGMREFICNHPQWDQTSAIKTALTNFLYLNGAQDGCIKDQYLAALFSNY
jgi:hypothetical protein